MLSSVRCMACSAKWASLASHAVQGQLMSPIQSNHSHRLGSKLWPTLDRAQFRAYATDSKLRDFKQEGDKLQRDIVNLNMGLHGLKRIYRVTSCVDSETRDCLIACDSRNTMIQGKTVCPHDPSPSIVQAAGDHGVEMNRQQFEKLLAIGAGERAGYLKYKVLYGDGSNLSEGGWSESSMNVVQWNSRLISQELNEKRKSLFALVLKGLVKQEVLHSYSCIREETEKVMEFAARLESFVEDRRQRVEAEQRERQLNQRRELVMKHFYKLSSPRQLMSVLTFWLEKDANILTPATIAYIYIRIVRCKFHEIFRAFPETRKRYALTNMILLSEKKLTDRHKIMSGMHGLTAVSKLVEANMEKLTQTQVIKYVYTTAVLQKCTANSTKEIDEYFNQIPYKTLIFSKTGSLTLKDCKLLSDISRLSKTLLGANDLFHAFRQVILTQSAQDLQFHTVALLKLCDLFMHRLCSLEEDDALLEKLFTCIELPISDVTIAWKILRCKLLLNRNKQTSLPGKQKIEDWMQPLFLSSIALLQEESHRMPIFHFDYSMVYYLQFFDFELKDALVNRACSYLSYCRLLEKQGEVKLASVDPTAYTQSTQATETLITHPTAYTQSTQATETLITDPTAYTQSTQATETLITDPTAHTQSTQATETLITHPTAYTQSTQPTETLITDNMQPVNHDAQFEPDEYLVGKIEKFLLHVYSNEKLRNQLPKTTWTLLTELIGTQQILDLSRYRAMQESGKREMLGIERGKSDIESGKLDIGSGKLDIESGKLDIESEKLDIESEKSDIGSEKLDIESGKLDIESEKSDIGSEKLDIESGKLEVAMAKTHRLYKTCAQMLAYKKPSYVTSNIGVPGDHVTHDHVTRDHVTHEHVTDNRVTEQATYDEQFTELYAGFLQLLNLCNCAGADMEDVMARILNQDHLTAAYNRVAGSSQFERVQEGLLHINRDACILYPTLRVPWFQSVAATRKIVGQMKRWSGGPNDLQIALEQCVEEADHLGHDLTLDYGIYIWRCVLIDSDNRTIPFTKEHYKYAPEMDVTRLAVMYRQVGESSPNTDHVTTELPPFETHLKKLGFRVVVVRSDEWSPSNNDLAAQDKLTWLRQKIYNCHHNNDLDSIDTVVKASLH